MRIISGKFKGKRLQAPKNLPVRPTTDMAKEALFNILNNHFYFSDIKVLDLFTGTGNISFEFASRGTASITSVDSHFGCIRFVAKIAHELALPIFTVKSDVFKFLKSHSSKYDVIFADPPYDFNKDAFNRIVEQIFLCDLLNDEGLLIVEHSKHTDLSDHKYFDYSKKYGGNKFSFFSNP